MGKFALRFMLAAGLFCLFASHAAKADTLTGTSSSCTTASQACWTDVTVTGSDTGYNNGETFTSIDTVTFAFSGGGETVDLTCTADCGTDDGGNPQGNGAMSAQLYGDGSYVIDSSLDTIGGSCASTTLPTDAQCTSFSDTSDNVCFGDFCNNSNGTENFPDVAALEAEGSGTFDIESLSINLIFTLPTTTGPSGVPEPSSLPLLGTGLFGLVVFGFRRSRTA
jgi:hypothetical protein